MNNITATETADLIEQQNAAALKLWTNLQILRSSTAVQTPNLSNAVSGLETAKTERSRKGGGERTCHSGGPRSVQ